MKPVVIEWLSLLRLTTRQTTWFSCAMPYRINSYLTAFSLYDLDSSSALNRHCFTWWRVSCSELLLFSRLFTFLIKLLSISKLNYLILIFLTYLYRSIWSDLIVNVQDWKIAYFQIVGPDKSSVFVTTVKVLDSLYDSITIAIGLVQFHSDKIAMP